MENHKMEQDTLFITYQYYRGFINDLVLHLFLLRNFNMFLQVFNQSLIFLPVRYIHFSGPGAQCLFDYFHFRFPYKGCINYHLMVALVWLLFYVVHRAIFREYARNKTYALKLHIEHRNWMNSNFGIQLMFSNIF